MPLTISKRPIKSVVKEKSNAISTAQKAQSNKTTAGFRKKALGLTSDQAANLRAVMEKSRTVSDVGCFMDPITTQVGATFRISLIESIVDVLMGQLNDETGFLPNTEVCWGTVFFYVIRCWAWHSFKAGMLQDMPVNCSQYVIPSWLACLFRANCPYKKDGVSLGYLSTVDDTYIKALHAPRGRAAYEWSSLQPLAMNDGEQNWSIGADVTGESVIELGLISAVFSSLEHKVVVENIPVFTTNPETFRDGNTPFLTSTRVASALNLYDSATAFRGVNVDPSPYPREALYVMAYLPFKPKQSLSGRFREAGFDPNFFRVEYRSINLSWVSLSCIDFLFMNKDIILPANMWKAFRAYYTCVVAYLASFAPSFVRNTLTNGEARAGFTQPSHRNTKVHSGVAMMQKPGVYRENGGITILKFSESAVLNPAYFWETVTTFGYTGGSNGSFLQVYFEGGPVAMELGWPVDTSNILNAFPLGRFGEFEEKVDGYGLNIFSNVTPKLHKCLCFASIVEASDSEIYGGVTVRYMSVRALGCNHSLDRNTCCWMYAGCLSQSLGNFMCKFMKVLGDRSNRIRLVSRAGTLRGATVTAVGQSRNVAEAYVGVTKDQYMGTAKYIYQTLTSNEMKKAAAEFGFAELAQPGAIPSWDQVHGVLTGTVPLHTALAVLWGASVAYGPRVWRAFRAMQVRTEL